jgi:trans-aconitate methyltransferase
MIWLSLVVLGLLIILLGAILIAALVHGWFMLRNSVPYVVLPNGAMEQVIKALGIRDSDVVYDLGCGDGRVILAMQMHNSAARYIGVENDLVVWLRARWRLKGSATLVRANIEATSLIHATRVFVYLGDEVMAGLEPRFVSELGKGARVVSVQFPLPHRAPDEVVELPASRAHAARLYVYNY